MSTWSWWSFWWGVMAGLLFTALVAAAMATFGKLMARHERRRKQRHRYAKGGAVKPGAVSTGIPTRLLSDDECLVGRTPGGAYVCRRPSHADRSPAHVLEALGITQTPPVPPIIGGSAAPRGGGI